MRRLLFVLAFSGLASWASLSCATSQPPDELVELERMRNEPELSRSDRQAFDLLIAADDLLLRARSEWSRGNAGDARRYAIRGEIKMRTALAMLQAERARARIPALNAELALATEEAARIDEQTAAVVEETALLQRLASIKADAAAERQALSEQVASAKKRVAADGQRLAAERHRGAAQDGIRRAESALRAAETVDAPLFAKAKYAAATAMLQAGRMEFDAGHWEDALARVELARTEAEESMAVAQPRYQSKAERLNDLARERALETDVTAIPGVQAHLERDGQVQRVVLILRGLFMNEGSVLSPEGARILEAVTTVVARYPRYPLQVTGYVGGPGGAALALAQANAVYWALVTRGIDPKRLNVDGRNTLDEAKAEARPAGRAAASRIEVSIPYHVVD